MAQSKALMKKAVEAAARYRPEIPGSELLRHANDARRTQVALEARLQEATESLYGASEAIQELKGLLDEHAASVTRLKKVQERVSGDHEAAAREMTQALSALGVSVSQARGRREWFVGLSGLAAGLVLGAVAVLLVQPPVEGTAAVPEAVYEGPVVGLDGPAEETNGRAGESPDDAQEDPAARAETPPVKGPGTPAPASSLPAPAAAGPGGAAEQAADIDGPPDAPGARPGPAGSPPPAEDGQTPVGEPAAAPAPPPAAPSEEGETSPGPASDGVPAAGAETPPPGETEKRPLLQVNAGSLRLRAGPGTGRPVVGQLLQGERVTVEAEEGDWLRVVADGGVRGWVHGAYLEPVADVGAAGD